MVPEDDRTNDSLIINKDQRSVSITKMRKALTVKDGIQGADNDQDVQIVNVRPNK